uniref:Uncharacterized protein n=1 Tax=Anguilla anguilla TaxID=7936 RepID=A0A0E9R696_ANGAN
MFDFIQDPVIRSSQSNRSHACQSIDEILL